MSALGITARDGWHNSSDVWIAMDRVYVHFSQAGFQGDELNAPSFRQVVMHEMGHSMGLPHLPENSLMYYQQSNAAFRVTCADVGQYLSLRGETDTCE
jgi:hypothetical protein